MKATHIGFQGVFLVLADVAVDLLAIVIEVGPGGFQIGTGEFGMMLDDAIARQAKPGDRVPRRRKCPASFTIRLSNWT